MHSQSIAGFRDIVRQAKRQGWSVELTPNSHWKFTPPDVTQPIHYTGSTPGNMSRYVKRLKCELSRKGLQLT